MPGSSDRNNLTVVVTVITLLVTCIGGVLAFRSQVLEDVAGELKHVVTRDELAEQRRVETSIQASHYLSIIRRLDGIEYQLRDLRAKVR